MVAPATMEMSYKDALYEVLRSEMEADDSVVLIGEDFANGGAFGVAGDLLERFGPERVIRTPISENSYVGVGVGAAMTGLRPVVEIMFMDFITLAMDQLVNHAAKIHYMYAGQYSVPIVVRTPAGAGRGYGASHSQSLESWLIQVPGLKVVAPSSPADAGGLLRSAIWDPNPVVFIENKLLYPKKGPVPEGIPPVPLGTAKVLRRGEDVTIATYGRMVEHALEAAAVLEPEGVSCEVIDLRTLKPLDVTTLSRSFGRTRRLVCVEEGTGGVGAEVCSRLAETAGALGGRMVRVAAKDSPIPSAGPLEARVVPQLEDIIEGCLSSLEG